MLCNKVNEYLEKDPSPDLNKIPDFIKDHVKTCHDCNSLVSYFRGLAMDKNLKPLANKETEEFMKSFEQKAIANSQKPALRSFWSGISWAYALPAFILLLLIGFYMSSGQKSPLPPAEVHSFAMLKGKATIIVSDGKSDTVTSTFEQVLTQDTGIEFAVNSEPVEIKYNNGGKVFLTGTGQMKVLKGGLNVTTGKFNARFKNLEGIMKVRVPCAVLAIRGTEIQFDIQPLRAEIMLVAGAADLIPDNALQTTIRLEAGKRVRLAENTWVNAEPAPRVVPEDKPVKQLPAPVASESRIQLPDDTDRSGEEQMLDTDGEPETETDDEGITEEAGSESMSHEAPEDDEPDFIGREGFFD